MHIYARGGHGGPIGPRGGIPLGTWPDTFMAWIKDLGFLEAPGAVTRAATDMAQFAERRAKSTR